MFKYPVKYEDYDGKPQEKTLWFNLSKAELLRMEIKTKDGLEKHLKEVSESKDRARILETFEWIISVAYGEKSDDGQMFVKNEKVLDAFKQSPAYDVFLIDLLTTEDAATAFVKGIVPSAASIRQAIPDAND